MSVSIVCCFESNEPARSYVNIKWVLTRRINSLDQTRIEKEKVFPMTRGEKLLFVNLWLRSDVLLSKLGSTEQRLMEVLWETFYSPMNANGTFIIRNLHPHASTWWTFLFSVLSKLANFLSSTIINLFVLAEKHLGVTARGQVRVNWIKTADFLLNALLGWMQIDFDFW